MIDAALITCLKVSIRHLTHNRNLDRIPSLHLQVLRMVDRCEISRQPTCLCRETDISAHWFRLGYTEFPTQDPGKLKTDLNSSIWVKQVG